MEEGKLFLSVTVLYCHDSASSSGASFFAWQRRARNASDW